MRLSVSARSGSLGVSGSVLESQGLYKNADITVLDKAIVP